MNNVRIELSLQEFRDLYITCIDNPDIKELKPLMKILDAKLAKMVEHELYTKYKTAPTEEEREKARLEFLDKKGVPTDFRW